MKENFPLDVRDNSDLNILFFGFYHEMFSYDIFRSFGEIDG